MAGKNDIADYSAGLFQIRPQEQAQGRVTETLQQNSIWQTKSEPMAVKKPYGEPSESEPLPPSEGTQASLKERLHNLPSAKFQWAPKPPNDLSDIFKQPSISDQVLESVEGKEKAEQSEQPKDKQLITATPEERERYVAQLRSYMQDQRSYANMELGGYGVASVGLLALRSSSPAGFAVTALGIGASLYTGFRSRMAHQSAKCLLDQMPNIDSQRFRPYETSMGSARNLIGDGYITTAGVSLMSMTKMTPYINDKTAGIALLASVGNHAYQANYFMPKTISAFDAEVQSWRKDLR